MKNKKRIAFLCIAINIILLLQLCLGTVMAVEEDAAYIEAEQVAEETQHICDEHCEEAVIVAQDGEMQIMPAADCVTYCSNCGNPRIGYSTFICGGCLKVVTQWKCCGITTGHSCY